MTRIEAVRSAFPVHRYPQAEFTLKVAELAGLGPAQRALLERLHGNAGVEYRHIALPLPEYGGLRGIEPANDRYIGEAADLGERALRGALDLAGLTGDDLDLLIVTSVTGVAVPSLDARLIPRLGSDGFRIVLTAELADVVERRLGGSVSAFLAEHGLTTEDISTWICHPGGPKVIDAIQKSLKLPDSAVELSRRSLAEVGNLSSASVLHILEKAIDAGPPLPGSAGLMVGLGPGVSAELVLLRW